MKLTIILILILIALSGCRSWCVDRYCSQDVARDSVHFQHIEPIPGESLSERFQFGRLIQGDTLRITGDRADITLSIQPPDSQHMGENEPWIHLGATIHPDTVRIDSIIPVEIPILVEDCPEPGGVVVPTWVFWPWVWASLLLLGFAIITLKLR